VLTTAKLRESLSLLSLNTNPDLWVDRILDFQIAGKDLGNGRIPVPAGATGIKAVITAYATRKNAAGGIDYLDYPYSGFFSVYRTGFATEANTMSYGGKGHRVSGFFETARSPDGMITMDNKGAKIHYSIDIIGYYI
jgi:hypothetical protein